MKYFPLMMILAVQAPAQPVTNPRIDFSPRSYLCRLASSPVQIDGRLDEPSWREAPWTEKFTDIEGPAKPLPRFATRVKMLWDQEYFYVAAELREPDVWGTIRERDAVIFYDNDFEVFIDPDGDTHQYYEFEMNALNSVWDLFLVKPYRDGGPAVNGWDIKGLKTAVHVEGTVNDRSDRDIGWSVELAFPWAALKEAAHREAPPKPGDQWRVNFSRVQWKTEFKDGKYRKMLDEKTEKVYPEDNWVWSPQGLINMHLPELWGFVQFSGGGEDSFKFSSDESIKWALRQIYYEEMKYFEKHRAYSPDLRDLGLADFKPECCSRPSIVTTPGTYEAVIGAADGSSRWHISQDGRTWKD